ncbi:uncharacterized protein GGS22DRAFT_19950 [Annulohypoxylon maeteangense]|uniref:uncharacterized protein n=1 Tax=Annulohypoxylon maeteangense TaxID=1927788 RepID=UPI002007B50B|nr:uncharacterized protein GGS22DRAFT_19950 [Annulohypoxylon maeteangense]KAI0884169.1 hypothetical protein GGS22DRAFT_19950 [Annulohypoxylon maeteangense]
MDLDSTGSTSGGQVTLHGRKSVPYGQACTNCSKAKCKCINRGVLGSICERCQRLGKQCVPSVSVRKRAVRRPAAERTAHLEEKLDDLVSILRAQAAGTPPTGAYRAGASDDLPDPGIDPDANAGPAMELDPTIGVVPVPGDKAASNTQPLPLPPPVEAAFCTRFTSMNSYPTPPSIASSQDGGPSPVEAEEILRVFQDRFLPFFPFVYIPPETTVAQLQQERPLLWLTIACTCSKSQERKAAYSQKIREYLAQKMMIDLDRNIDLLLGVVCYLGWGMHHFTGKPYINAYINMAVTIVADLRLDKPPQDNFYRELHCFKPTYGYPKVLSTHRTNEERRATLACFILCSGISNFLRTQTMRWTPHMEDSLQKLAASPETPNDELLVVMVRTYRIQEDIAQITWRAADHSGNSNSVKAPPFIYVKALRANLEAIKEELPASLKDNKVVLSHLYAAEIAIADMSLWNVNPWLTAHPPRPAPISGSSGNGIDVGKLDAYYSSLQASKASLENFLSFAPGEYMCLSMSLTLHFGRATQTVYRLMVVDDPEWDRNIVKAAIDLMSVMERTANRFLQVPQICGIETSDDPEMLDYYTKAANALRATIPSWTATLEQLGCVSSATATAVAAASTPVSGAGAGAETMFPPGTAIPELSSMEWLDDPWLTDMLRSWEGS